MLEQSFYLPIIKQSEINLSIQNKDMKVNLTIKVPKWKLDFKRYKSEAKNLVMANLICFRNNNNNL